MDLGKCKAEVHVFIVFPSLFIFFVYLNQACKWIVNMY